MRTLVLPQFEGPQTIARMVLGSIAPCLRFSALSPIFRNLSSQFITRIVNGCRTNLIFLLDRGGRIKCYLYACKTANRSVSKMFVLLSSPSDILDLTVEQLRYIPKPVLLRVCGHYVHHLWDRLPEHLKADSEIQQYRRCAFAATVDCNVRNNGDKSELPNPILYVPEACSTDSERNHRTLVAEQLSARTVTVRRSNRRYRRDSIAERTSLLLSDLRLCAPINRREIPPST